MFSLENRLKRRLMLGILLVSLVFVLAVRMQIQRQQNDLLDYQLEQVARALIASDVKGAIQDWDDDPALHLDVQLWDAAGGLIYKSSEQLELGLDSHPGFSYMPSGTEDDAVMLRVFTISSSWRTVQVMHSQDLRDNLILDAEFEVLIPTLLAIVFGVLAVASTIKKELEPIRELDEEIRRRDPSSLAPIDLPDAPTELSQVISTLNHLLAQLDTSMTGHKRFIANAAHELRTPVTALRLDVANLLSGSDPAQSAQTIERLRMGVNRSHHLLQQMLTLARLEAHANPKPFVGVDLPALTRESMVGLSVMASQRGVEFELETQGLLKVQGDPDELRLLLDNLLGNALKFSPAQSVVQVRLDQHGVGVNLTVRDHGPGITPEMRERIVLPFVRVNAAIEGAGLGLTIAQEVVRTHGATLSFEDPPQGAGLLVRVCFSVA